MNILPFNKILALVTIFSALSAQFVTTGGLWNDPDNWIGGELPTGQDNVVINGTSLATHGAVCNNLHIPEG